MFIFLLYLLGILLISYGCFFCVLNFNYIASGHTILEYFVYILTKGECLITLLGIILIIGCLERKRLYQILLQFKSKFHR